MTQQPFIPRPGQVDFTNIRWCPVINCAVQYKNKILLVKRSKEMRLYPECWNGISGFLDDDKIWKKKYMKSCARSLAYLRMQLSRGGSELFFMATMMSIKKHGLYIQF